MTTMFGDLAATFSRWRTWALMAGQDITMRYRRSVLGPFWISISMAALVLGIGLLYSQVMHQPFKEYLYFLACGFLIWNLLSSLINEGCNIVIEAEGHLRSVPIPTPVLAARMVYRNFVIFLHNVLVVGAMVLLFGKTLTLSAAVAPLGVLLIVLIGYFGAIALGPICARFRDIAQVIANVMQVAFFLSPIIWGMNEADARSIVKDANPFYHLLEIVRAPLLGAWPTAANWIVSASILGFAFLAALWTLATTRRRIYLWL
jgi:lipopolysaccharide transport system permease protein